MNISSITVIPIENRSFIKATVQIVIDDVLKIRDIRIKPRKGGKGVYVAYPCRQLKDETYYSIAHPINAKAREELDNYILMEYDRVVGEQIGNDEMAHQDTSEADKSPDNEDEADLE